MQYHQVVYDVNLDVDPKYNKQLERPIGSEIVNLIFEYKNKKVINSHLDNI